MRALLETLRVEALYNSTFYLYLKREDRQSLVAFYNIRPRNRAGLFFQPVPGCRRLKEIVAREVATMREVYFLFDLA